MIAHYLNNRLLLALLVIMTFGVFLFPGNAKALTMTPARFEIRGNPGDTLNEEMLLINETDGPETLYSSFANFEAQGESGNPAFVAPTDGLGTWIKTDENTLTLTPGQQKIVPFKVVIPKDAEPGGHFAVIFWGNNPGSGASVAVGAKTGVLVLLSVNGEVKESGGLLNFNTTDKQFFYNTLPVSLEYRFKNDGGDRIKPSGQVVIRDSVFFPADYLNANPAEGNVLPNSTRKINIDWVKYKHPGDYKPPTGIFSRFWSNVSYQWNNFAFGLYSANLNLMYGSSGQHVYKTVFFFVFPWQLLLVMLLIFLILFFGGKKLIKHYNQYIIKRASVGQLSHKARNGK